MAIWPATLNLSPTLTLIQVLDLTLILTLNYSDTYVLSFIHLNQLTWRMKTNPIKSTTITNAIATISGLVRSILMALIALGPLQLGIGVG